MNREQLLTTLGHLYPGNSSVARDRQRVDYCKLIGSHEGRSANLYLSADSQYGDGDAVFLLIEALNERGIQVELTTYPPQSNENRPSVVLRIDSNGETLFPEGFFGDTPAWAIAEAFVAAMALPNVQEGLR